MIEKVDPPLPERTPAAAISDDDFEELMAGLGPFEGRPHVAVAVSGGTDSLCLAFLAGRWAKRRGGRVWGLTVDHGLRPESAGEARRVGGWLDAEGISHRILVWQGPKPRTGLQAAARRARYGLMSSWCRDAGVLHLLLAHTLDDQAETFLLRLGSGSGPDGLAAMAAIRETPDVRLLRPLLGVRKPSLAAALAARGQEWIEDPSNRDPAFARTRIRQAMSDGGLEAAQLARSARRFGRARVALETAATQVLARSAFVHPAGFARLDRLALGKAPEEVGLRAFSRVLTAIGGRDYGPKLKKLERLYGDLMTETGQSGTLGGCRVIAEAEKFLVCRETRGLPDPVAVRPGLRLTWDRRFSIAFSGDIHADRTGPGGNCFLRGLGRRGWSDIVRIRPELRRTPIPGPARLSLPAVFDDDGVLLAPHLNYRRPRNPGSGPGFDQGAGVEIAEIRLNPPNTLSKVGFFLNNEPDILSH